LSVATQSRTAVKVKLDAVCAAAVDLAREAATGAAADFGVGEHRGVVATDDRVVTHLFECPHPGYPGWHWAVTVVRAARARAATVNEVALLPGDGALLAQPWVPWAERIGAKDLAPGMLLPTPDNDPRLEPGFTGADQDPDADPADASATRVIVAELGLGRERVLSREGREMAAERWIHGEGGPHAPLAKQAPAHCQSCGYFVALQGSLGTMFGACTNEFSPSDGHVVALDHGCGGHSDVAAEQRGIELEPPVHDTISTDTVIFD